MKINDPGAEVVRAAAAGDLAAIDHVLLSIQPGVFHLALRMLGQREDAADASQEILLKVVTHLGGFRAEAAFTTWVFQIARNHLLNASTRQRESPEVSLEAIAARLQQGLEFSASLGDPLGAQPSLTPEDKAQAREVALSCTQNMLMSLDREQRLTYLLDAVFGLNSNDAAEVLGISAAAYRQRLARTRAILEPFMQDTCGLVNPQAACRCEKQLPGLRHEAAQTVQTTGTAAKPITLHPRARQPSQPNHRAEAEQAFGAMLRMSDAAALFRSQPLPEAPQALMAAIRGVLRAEGYWHDKGRAPLQ
jgi:RNA polymerase sigma factor (sigma-70 family)